MSAHEDDASRPCERCGVTLDVHEYISPNCTAGEPTSEGPMTDDIQAEAERLAVGHLPDGYDEFVCGLVCECGREERVAEIAAALRRQREEGAREERESHHALGRWVECPHCTKFFSDDMNSAAYDSALGEVLQDKWHLGAEDVDEMRREAWRRARGKNL